MMARIIVVGGSFAGLTAAFELRRHLSGEHEVTVVSSNSRFVFIPSMPWIVLGSREEKDVTFDLEPVLKRKGIEFVHDALQQVDMKESVIYTTSSTMHYDYLLLATGPALDFDAVPGIGPHGGYSQSVCSLPHSKTARKAWEKFLENPGPVVIGAAQGASCFGAGYEFLLNIDTYLRKHGLRDKAPVTWVTSEPELGHFGLGGIGNSAELVKEMLKSRDIQVFPNHAIKQVTKDIVELDDGTRLPHQYSMIIPPFKGIDAIFQSPGLGNAKGFIPVTQEYRHPDYSNVFAAGVNVAMAPPEKTPIPTGVPKTGYMSEHMAKTAAANIVADLTHGQPTKLDPTKMKALCLLDAGDSGVYMVADPVFPPQTKYSLRAGSWVHGAKIAFEKYFMWKMKNGLTQLK
ncbi:NAD(P)/FAD-dependent oxidoreductase [Alicyclobacillus sp. SO9]|uniref:NAD(P)/FAD-dependent oxidoreductase n=1 Tax=Alicyclobacillus sp. SO9 TaxID=2665646 RepID=UPI0018E7583C|nr:FAD/NAD(P)-binding oxidoreductase [Alicyclobacillus sp. SO9]QQE78283.1 NAD(P)/FAD-dependent oxidoreductase [Alicyclobacillus sp. SO9]